MAKRKIGIDIGHGENTAENGSKRVFVNNVMYEEHHFNAHVGLIVEKRLKELGFDVYKAQPAYKNDVPLATRVARYNAQKCDMVISIHANAGAASANGMGIFYWKGNKEGLRFSRKFVENWKGMVDGVGLWGDGIWESVSGTWTNFYIVRNTRMTTLLLEAGFFTNIENDFQYIHGKHKNKFREQCAEVIVKTVCDHYGVAYKKGGNTVTVPKPTEVNKGNYKIKRGDTFYSIARDFGVSVNDLMKANPKVNHKALKIGSYITIPKKSTSKPNKAPSKPQGNMTTDSIVVYLNSIGVDSSFKNREKLAKQYGISNYRGTASQNTQLLALLRKGSKPAAKPKGNQTTKSIVEYLNSIGVSSSFSNREKLAKQHGISNYKGTASQNLELLKKIRGH